MFYYYFIEKNLKISKTAYMSHSEGIHKTARTFFKSLISYEHLVTVLYVCAAQLVI